MNEIVEKDCLEILGRLTSLMPNVAGKTFLIAGATSFLGKSIINTLLYYNRHLANNDREKCKIYGLYHNKEKALNIFGKNMDDEYFCLQQWDAIDPCDFLKLDVHIDYIFYLCSIASTGVSMQCPVETIQANTIGLSNMLVFAKRRDVKSFLYFSSGAIYAAPQGTLAVVRESDRWPSNHLANENVYAESKRIGETFCTAFYTEYNTPVKIVRISHTYGPGIDINDGRIFSDFVKNIVNNEDLVIKGDGSATRPFCYITDAVAAFLIITIKGTNGEAYNLANPEETYSIGELAEKLTETAFPERRLRPRYIHEKGDIHPDKVYVNIDKLRAIGWKPMVSVVDGFRRVVKSIEYEKQ